jgi:single-strand selective monofunctional uracil DNA glycosylase
MSLLIESARALIAQTAPLRFGAPVTHVYRPLEYAWAPHACYLERYGKGRKEVVLVGMNPGPFGMAQTGVPFGEVGMVRDWLRIDAPVGKPPREHPSRPILGFSCPRREVSGQRLWGWARQRFRTPRRFFARFWVHNYCPLVFMAASGRNVTPDKLPAREREPLFEACDRALRAVVAHVRPQLVIGVGRFAEQRAQRALGDCGVVLGRIPHPSPASPLANRGWAAAVGRALADLGVSA